MPNPFPDAAQVRLAQRLAEAFVTGDWDAAAIAECGVPAAQVSVC